MDYLRRPYRLILSLVATVCRSLLRTRRSQDTSGVAGYTWEKFEPEAVAVWRKNGPGNILAG